MRFRVVALGLTILCHLSSINAFKKKERLAIAFLAGMVVGQQGRQSNSFPVPVPWPVQGGNQVVPLPLPIPIGGGHSATNKKIYHNTVEHHHHFRGGHRRHYDSSNGWQQSEWRPRLLGDHSRFMDYSSGLSEFSDRLGNNYLGQGYNSYGRYGSSVGDFGGLRKKSPIKRWDLRASTSSVNRKSLVSNDDFGDDFEADLRFLGDTPELSSNRLPLIESKHDFKVHSLFPESSTTKAEDNNFEPKPERLSTVSLHLATHNKHLPSDIPPTAKSLKLQG